jgi:hypothetical protein
MRGRHSHAAGHRFPDTEDDLRALPGIGAYTSAAIAAIAFDRPAAVVDGNVERVMTRLYAIATPMPEAKAEVRAALTPLVPAAPTWRLRAGDDGPWRDDLHTEAAEMHALSRCRTIARRCLNGDPELYAGQGEEGRETAATRGGLRRRSQARRRGAARQAAGQGPARVA